MNALFVAWRSGDSHDGKWGPVGRLELDGTTYRFCYTRGARTLQGFQPFSEMNDLEQVYESEELFPLFSNRLLSRTRPEYDAYLAWSGFDPNEPPEPIAILGVTEGRRQTDSIEVFPCPIRQVDGCYLNKFFLHGVRWMPHTAIERIGRLKQEEPLFMMLDVQNVYDPYAVGLRTVEERTLIGYVPRYLAEDVWKLWQSCERNDFFVQKVNRDAPAQQRVLCRMHACWPEGFKPCSGEAFLPIPNSVPVTCEAP